MTSPTLYDPRPERWPQVSLKGFFLVVTVLCVAVGWLGVQVKWIQDRHEAVKWTDDYGEIRLLTHGSAIAPWSIRLLGERGHAVVILMHQGTPHTAEDDRLTKRVKPLFPEATIAFTYPARAPRIGKTADDAGSNFRNRDTKLTRKPE